MKRTLATKEIQYLRIKIKGTEVQQLTMHILNGKIKVSSTKHL